MMTFAPVEVDPPFDKRELDADFVRQRECLVTRGYRRLLEIQGQNLPILDYPLPEVRAELERRAHEA